MAKISIQIPIGHDRGIILFGGGPGREQSITLSNAVGYDHLVQQLDELIEYLEEERAKL